MKSLNIKYTKYILGVIAVILIFIALAQWSQQHTELLKELTMQAGWSGALLYMVIMAISIIFAPLNTGFLLPVAANSYGPFLAAVYSIVGWTAGSMVAFWIARHFGKRTIKYKNFIEKIQLYEKTVSKPHFYGLIILFRISLPVDLVSYALGFASAISYPAFFVTTLVGVTPMTFLFTYAATSSFLIQIVVGSIAMVIFLCGAYFAYLKYSTGDNKE